MLRSRVAEYVPLPDVGEHSDRITIGQLGLPVGFDERQLLLNVPMVERTATMAGLGHISISAGEGAHDELSFTASGIGRDGSITAGGLRRVRKASLHDSPRLSIEDTLPYQRYRPEGLRINMSAVEDSIQADGNRWKRGLLDPGARAHYMNKGLRGALWQASIESHRPRLDDIMAIPTVGGSYWLNDTIMRMSPYVNVATTAATLFLIAQGVNKMAEILERRHADEDLPPAVGGILPGMAVERIPLTGLMAHVTKLIKAA